MKNLFLTILLCLLAPQVYAGDIKWEGTYRFEALKVYNPSLTDGGNNKGYVLNHLTLKPRFQAFDGLTIHSRFDIFNSPQFPNDQLGQTFGAGLNPTPGTPVAPSATNPGSGTNSANSNVLGDQQPAGLIAVNELYGNWTHEFGMLTVGRAPMHFGLGIMFNGGGGVFDHWLENRDLIAYTLKMGGFSVMPVIAKSYEGLLGEEDDVNDYILQVNYGNPETELDVGFIYQARRSTSNANSNDIPSGPVGGAAAVQSDNYEVDSYNVYVSQWVDKIKVAFELGFMSGNTGLINGGQEIDHNGFGGALKLSWFPQESNWGAEIDLGYASGDDPSTQNTYEGYVFDQNYDVAFLLFNHPLGSQDLLRTSYLSNIATAGAVARTNPSNSFDVEAISNTFFASGAVHYRWDEDKFDFQTRLTYAQLAKDPLQTDVDSNLGFEIDLSLKYEPFKGFQWINRAGVLLPGAAFEGGTLNSPVNTAFGFETKAAISF